MNSFRLKMALGFVMVIGLLALGAAIALGKVEEKTSFGLTAVTAVLGKVVLDFSQWAYNVNANTNAQEEDKKGEANG